MTTKRSWTPKQDQQQDKKQDPVEGKYHDLNKSNWMQLLLLLLFGGRLWLRLRPKLTKDCTSRAQAQLQLSHRTISLERQFWSADWTEYWGTPPHGQTMGTANGYASLMLILMLAQRSRRFTHASDRVKQTKRHTQRAEA
ncbi:hypothetical protein ACLKA7_010872 [Drosophila subpalustris]